MSQIKILPEFLANQIAAGEVVERPASVVKELLENAIDAGATTLEIDIDGAGTRSIRIIDNGTGMDQDDILLCLERHATSKLTNAEQLSTISTLGFRGEAIPSIASVSKVTITSRPPESDLGSTIYVHYGSIKKVHDMGCAAGTMIEVQDLFGNVPARRKFLKTAQTELAHIDEVVRSYCLAKPQIGFSYRVGGKRVFHLLDNADSAKNRFQTLVSGEIDLIELCSQPLSSEVRITGFLVPPDQASGKLAKLWAFVNGRFVKDRLLSHAVSEGMQGFLMKGRRPGGLIFVEIDPHDIDVNVHPTKQEVRFRNSGQIHRAISNTVSLGLREYQQQVRRAVFGKSEANCIPAQKSSSQLGQSMSGLKLEGARVEPLLAQRRGQPEKIRQSTVFEKLPIPDLSEHNRVTTSFVGGARDGSSVRKIDAKGLENRDESFDGNNDILCECEQKSAVALSLNEQSSCYNSTMQSDSIVRTANLENVSSAVACAPVREEADSSIRLIGQLFNAYILCEVDGGLVVVDQHAAQERLIFEELKSQHAKSAVPSQSLLFPEMVELSASEITVLEQYGQEISRLGLDVQAFGGTTYVVNAIPVTLTKASGAEVLREIIDRYRVDTDRHPQSRLDAILSGMACKASIKAGHKLQREEIQSLLDQLQLAGVFSHCPHGRPVVKKFTDKDVQKWFYRT